MYMDIFLLGMIGFMLVGFVVFVIASLRLERQRRARKGRRARGIAVVKMPEGYNPERALAKPREDDYPEEDEGPYGDQKL